MKSRYRCLFIHKRRHSYWGHDERFAVMAALSSGLGNSANFLVDLLTRIGVTAASTEVVDNNSIDREVTSYGPTHAVIEALWVVPEKFDLLKTLHPRVQWIVRLHSEAPFLAGESVAAEWITGYLHRGVEVMCNSAAAQQQLRMMAVDCGASEALVTWGPNFYPFPGPAAVTMRAPIATGEAHIGCFGAVRPLKNHLTQAIAAISFANAHRVKLRFHINGGRIEGAGAPVLRNLRALFAASAGGQHQLVEHAWLPRPEFLAALTETDIGMQASFSETFNIVSADSAAVGLPVIGSAAIPWLGSYAQVAPGDVNALEGALHGVWGVDLRQRLAAQSDNLRAWSAAAQAAWASRFP